MGLGVALHPQGQVLGLGPSQAGGELLLAAATGGDGDQQRPGITGDGSTTGASLLVTVSPVEVSASLATASMSPATTWSAGLAAHGQQVADPLLVLARLVALNTTGVGPKVPETTRNRLIRPT